MIIEESAVKGIWSNLKDHPKCPHGPTLLFSRHVNGEPKYFYACSACRDRKLCNFYLEKGQDLTKIQSKHWQDEIKKMSQSYNHIKGFIKFNQLLSESPSMRVYCHTCEKLMSIEGSEKHKSHEITINLSDEQMKTPTNLLKPLSNVKKEAQYLFSKKATEQIVDMALKLGIKAFLCIGAPRIHEFLMQNYDGEVSSLLLDFDPRFHNFFGPLNYCWYNLFNHHFFNSNSQQVFKDFMTQNNGKNILLICDPPFGGRVEFMSQTIKTIADLHKKWNNLSKNDELNIMFIFPYFMESIIKFKSNPSGVSGGLQNLKMLDYKVDYDNHPLFVTGSSGRKYGSPVRIFTNIALNLLKLPEADGYKYCKRCDKWVSLENKHCKKCKACTSKDGRRYKHCNKCGRCVKPTWKHCKVCERCALEKHSCNFKPRIPENAAQDNEVNNADIEGSREESEALDVERNKYKSQSFKSTIKRTIVTKPSSGKKRKIQSDSDTANSPRIIIKNKKKEKAVNDNNSVRSLTKKKMKKKHKNTREVQNR